MKYKFKEINTICKINFDGYINDLSIDTDNSYCVNDVIVHNCGCLTTQNTGVGYPMASLIKECYEESLKLDNPAKIVADGGMKDYSDVIKALGLGADYVMLGSILNKAFESAGDMYLWKKLRVNSEIAEIAYKIGIPIYKKFRGMSTKEVQMKWGAKKTKTSEGVVRFRRVEYRLEKWVENFEDYLRSAMSYSGAHNLEEFIGRAEFVQISSNAYKRFNK
jgi:IMP dehydrogenase/GMP reductase